jgi:hypothetical protein
MVTGTEVSIREPQYLDAQFNDTHLSTLRTTSKLFAASGMFDDARSEAQAFVKIMAGRELGITALMAMTKIYIVKGKIMVGADIVASKIKSSGKYDYRIKKLDNNACVIDFFENKELVYTSNFTIEDARKAKLIKEGGAWETWPRPMLFSKAITQGGRIVCPHILNGAYTPEEFGIETDDDGHVKDMKQVITVVPSPTIVDEVTGEIIEEDITKDLAPGAHPASSPVDQAPKKICPIHKKPFIEGKYGWYCKTKLDNGKWCNEKPHESPVMTPEEVQQASDLFDTDKPMPNPEKKAKNEALKKLKKAMDMLGYDAETVKSISEGLGFPVKSVDMTVEQIERIIVEITPEDLKH